MKLIPLVIALLVATSVYGQSIDRAAAKNVRDQVHSMLGNDTTGEDKGHATLPKDARDALRSIDTIVAMGTNKAAVKAQLKGYQRNLNAMDLDPADKAKLQTLNGLITTLTN